MREKHKVSGIGINSCWQNRDASSVTNDYVPIECEWEFNIP